MPIQIDLGSSTAEKPTTRASGPVVGIDLGTTYSLVASVRDGKPLILKREGEEALVPSVVLLDETGRLESVGAAARSQRARRAGNALFSVKRLLGRSLKDLGADAAQIPYELVEDDVGAQVRIRVGTRVVSPVEISAEILRVLKARAEKALGVPVERAVVTVPAYFDDAQRTATKAAGRLAGLEILRVMNEPTAAALGYGWSSDQPGTVAVFDLGGGTFDVSILRIDQTVLEVLATAGDTHLGGDDFDWVLAEHALGRLVGAGYGPAPENDEERRRLLAGLLDEAERAKRELSLHEKAGFSLGGLKIEITRTEADQLWLPLVNRALESCSRALSDARLQPQDLDDVLLVGGSTRVPLVVRKVREFFGREPNTSLNPDEAVALGAAKQAHVLAGHQSDQLLLDIIPLSLGIETMGGAVSKLILRNSGMPNEARENYTNHADNQTAFDIHVLQGERELAKDCRSLARFRLRGLPPAPAGFHRVEVLFRVDANGILNVRAKDLRTGKAHEVEVRPSFGISDDELMGMLETSIDRAEEDMNARQLVDLRVEADTVVRATEKALANAGHLIGARERAEAQARLVDLRNSAAGGTPRSIREAMEALNEATRELAELQVNAALSKALSGKGIGSVE